MIIFLLLWSLLAGMEIYAAEVGTATIPCFPLWILCNKNERKSIRICIKENGEVTSLIDLQEKIVEEKPRVIQPNEQVRIDRSRLHFPISVHVARRDIHPVIDFYGNLFEEEVWTEMIRTSISADEVPHIWKINVE